MYLNTATGPKYSNNRVILRPNVEINYDILMRHIFWCTWNAQVIAQSHKAGSAAGLPLLSQPTRSLNGGLLVRADAEKKNQVSHDD